MNSIDPSPARDEHDVPRAISRNARWIGIIIAAAMIAFVILERI